MRLLTEGIVSCNPEVEVSGRRRRRMRKDGRITSGSESPVNIEFNGLNLPQRKREKEEVEEE